jgi:hypothetical protein
MSPALAPVYDDRATMRQYDRCHCGRLKARRSAECLSCWNLTRRKRDHMRELHRLERRKGTPAKC